MEENTDILYNMTDDREFDPNNLTDEDYEDIANYLFYSDNLPREIDYEDLETAVGWDDGDHWWNPPEEIIGKVDYTYEIDDYETALDRFVMSYIDDKKEKNEKFYGKDVKNLFGEIYDFFYDWFEEDASIKAAEEDWS